MALCDLRSPLFRDRDVLHFAPEATVTRLIMRSSRSYLSADLREGRASVVLDLESIEQPDAAWDVIVASHVLEHVDDGRAIGELHRVLRRGGLLVAMVPLVEGWATTYENPAVSDSSQRELHFGQSDHVRYYGADFADRLRAGGFEVAVFVATGQECAEHGLTRGEKVFLATRR